MGQDYQHRTTEEEDAEELVNLAETLIPYFLKHNAEADAVDLSSKIGGGTHWHCATCSWAGYFRERIAKEYGRTYTSYMLMGNQREWSLTSPLDTKSFGCSREEYWKRESYKSQMYPTKKVSQAISMIAHSKSWFHYRAVYSEAQVSSTSHILLQQHLS